MSYTSSKVFKGYFLPIYTMTDHNHPAALTANDLNIIKQYHQEELDKIQRSVHKDLAPIKNNIEERKLNKIRKNIQNS